MPEVTTYKTDTDFQSVVTEIVAQLWEPLPSTARFSERGLDSMTAVRIQRECQKRTGIRLPLTSFLGDASINSVVSLLAAQCGESVPETKNVPAKCSDPRSDSNQAQKSSHERGALTPVQATYWVGRGRDYPLGGISPRFYAEYELEATQSDIPRIVAAWQKVVQRHGMLRATVDSNGIQHVTSRHKCGEHHLAVHHGGLEATRERLAHRVPNLAQWPVHDVEITILNPEKLCIHVGFEVILLDFFSIQRVLDDWGAVLAGEELGSGSDGESSSTEFIDLPHNQATPSDLNFWQHRQLPPSPFPDLLKPQPGFLARQQKLLKPQPGFLARQQKLLKPHQSEQTSNLQESEQTSKFQELHSPRTTIQSTPQLSSSGSFQRHTARIPATVWSQVQQCAEQRGASPSGTLLAVAAHALHAAGASREFSLATTFFSPESAEVEGNAEPPVGDYTRTGVVKVENSGTFTQRAQAATQELWETLDHSTVTSAQIAALQGYSPTQLAYPVVFTSAVGHPTAKRWPGKLTWGVTQTPQVAMDMLHWEENSDLILAWDCLDAVLPPRCAERALHVATSCLAALAEPSAWDGPVRDPWLRQVQAVPEGTIGVCPRAFSRSGRAEVEIAAADAKVGGSGDSAVASDATELTATDAPAVIAADGVWTHQELCEEAARVAVAVAKAQADIVLVMMRKSRAQVAAVAGIVRAGAAYIPVDPDWPETRVQSIIKRSGARWCMTDPDIDVPADLQRIAAGGLQSSAAGGLQSSAAGGLRGIEPAGHADREDLLNESLRETLQEEQQKPQQETPQEPMEETSRETLQVLLQEIPHPEPSDLAYAIFTSGSTGEPKGVAIEHRQAAATIRDVDKRFAISAQDRVLGVSALSFDLSVWDIFGVLSAGGSIVLPDDTQPRDPAYWMDLIARHGVTIWNSAPALLEMLVDYAELNPAASRALHTLRLVMLSGDWIPVTLPGRLKALVPHVEIYSLGGATEAAIWSIAHHIEPVDAQQPSIPYGTALTGQYFRILDDAAQPVAIGEPGHLYIGGAGVARGYLGDPEKTAERFVSLGERLYNTGDLGERLYNTGDLGMWLDNGEIRFLGRDDRQVKINGFRIELGEVDAGLCRSSLLKSGVCTVSEDTSGMKRLIAHVVPELTADYSDAALRQELQDLLPSYMVPSRFEVYEELPVTANGKIDYKKLMAPARVSQERSVGEASGRLSGEASGRLSGEASGRLSGEASGNTFMGNVSAKNSAGRAPSETSTKASGHISTGRLSGIVSTQEFGGRTPTELGINSLDIIRVVNRIEEKTGIRPALVDIYRAPWEETLRRAAGAVAGSDSVGAEETAYTPDPASTAGVDQESREGMGALGSIQESGSLAGQFTEVSAQTQLPGIPLQNKELSAGSAVSPNDVVELASQCGGRVIAEFSRDDHTLGRQMQAVGAWLAQHPNTTVTFSEGDVWCRIVQEPTAFSSTVASGPVSRASSATTETTENNCNMLQGDGVDIPFDLTPLQQSYLVGTQGDLPFSQPSAHFYVDYWVPDVTFAQIVRAVELLIQEQPMLRAVITADGRQKVLPADGLQPPAYQVHDLEEARATWPQEPIDPESWPNFRVGVCQPAGVCESPEAAPNTMDSSWSSPRTTELRGTSSHTSGPRTSGSHTSGLRLCVQASLLFFDGWSFYLFFERLISLARNPRGRRFPQLTFQRYQEIAADPLRRRRDRAWWENRLAELPLPPNLPATQVTRSGVRRASSKIAQDSLLRRAARAGVSPAAFIGAAWASVICELTGDPELLLAVLYFNRQEITGAEELLGPFSTTTLVPTDGSPEDFAESLAQSVSHNAVSGVEVARMLSARRGTSGVVAPVVFTSNLGFSGRMPAGIAEAEGFERIMTPSVLLDLQAAQLEDVIELNLDSPIGAFEESLPQQLVDCLVARLGTVEPVLLADGVGAPVYLLHPSGGDIVCYLELAQRLPMPVYGIADPGLYGLSAPTQISELARLYGRSICEFHNAHYEGGFYIGGWSMGGTVAQSVAHLLQTGGVAADVEVNAGAEGVDAGAEGVSRSVKSPGTEGSEAGFEHSNQLLGLIMLDSHSPDHIRHISGMDNSEVDAEFARRYIDSIQEFSGDPSTSSGGDRVSRGEQSSYAREAFGGKRASRGDWLSLSGVSFEGDGVSRGNCARESDTFSGSDNALTKGVLGGYESTLSPGLKVFTRHLIGLADMTAPAVTDLPTLLVIAEEQSPVNSGVGMGVDDAREFPLLGWGGNLPENTRVLHVQGHHYSILRESVEVIASAICNL